MRKLKLEVQLSVDGFVADPKGKTNWMVWDWTQEWTWDRALRAYHIRLHASSDTIVMGRKMASGFVDHWKQVSENPRDPQYAFAKPITAMKKYVFTKTLKRSRWEHTELLKGNIVTEIKKLKKQKGKDILVYGGASFVASLIKENLIDEYHLLINPVILGKGKTIYQKITGIQNLTPGYSKTFSCGVSLVTYKIQTR
jgi:dihydrofolate reductase